MTPEHAAGGEYLDAYVAVRDRLAALARTCDGEAAVPACPGWRVRDVLAHLTGLCDDWVSQRLDGYASDAWTADHVSRYGGCSCEEILDRWADAIVSFARLEQAAPVHGPARWAFGDAVIHEADIRSALAVDRVADDAVLLSLRGTVSRWQQEVQPGSGIRTLHVRTTDGPDWWLGTRDDREAVVLEVPIYEVFRGLAGRRSEEQVREWSWSADPEPFIGAGLPFPFRWASAPLLD